MEYRPAGKSGLKVSAVSLGAWLTYGSSAVEEEKAIQCIRKAIDPNIILCPYPGDSKAIDYCHGKP